MAQIFSEEGPSFVIQHEEWMWDKDSTFGDDESDTTSVPDDYYEPVYRHHRIYPLIFEQYPWPIDERELERQEEQFYLLYALCNGRLQHAPVQDPTRVLDIGTGTGCWAIEFADRYPISEVSGLDLVPIQTEWVPCNCELLIDNFVVEDWQSPYRDVDFIHIGRLAVNEKTLRNLLKEAYWSCSRGGWVEITEFTVELREESGSDDFGRFYASLREAYGKEGRLLDSCLACQQAMETQGFVDVTEVVYKLPLKYSEHSGDLQGMIVENWAAGFEAYSLELMAGKQEISTLEALLLCAAARKELKTENDHGYLKWRVIYGQKPKFTHEV